MTEGVVITPAELIKLRQFVQKNHAHPRARAVKSGIRHSRLRGRGMDFAEVRNYQAGDEIRHMEWRATARTGRPHIKLYEEERERPVILLVDFNPSMYFGTRHEFKSVLAAKLAALTAWIANKRGDKVGGFIFSGEQHIAHAPRARLEGLLPLLHDLAAYTDALHQNPRVEPKAFAHALRDLKRVLKPGSLLVIISDFYGLDNEAISLLGRIRQHNDIFGYHILDAIECAPPKLGTYPITNGAAHTLLHLDNKKRQSQYESVLSAWQDTIKTCFHQLNAPYYPVTSETDWVRLLNRTFGRSTHA